MPEWWVDELVPDAEVSDDFERELRGVLADAWPTHRGRAPGHGRVDRRRLAMAVLGVAAAVVFVIATVVWVGGPSRPRITPSTNQTNQSTAPTEPTEPPSTSDGVLSAGAMKAALRSSEWVQDRTEQVAALYQPAWLRFNADLSTMDGFTGCYKFQIDHPLDGDHIVTETPPSPGGGTCGPHVVFVAGEQLQVVSTGGHLELRVLRGSTVRETFLRVADLSPVSADELTVSRPGLSGPWQLWGGTLLTFRDYGPFDVGGCATAGNWSSTSPGTIRFDPVLSVSELSACAGLAEGSDMPIPRMLTSGEPVSVLANGDSVLLSTRDAKLWMTKLASTPDPAVGLDVMNTTLWGLRMGQTMPQSLVEKVLQHAVFSVTASSAPAEQVTTEQLVSPSLSCRGDKGVVLSFGGLSVVLSVQPTGVTIVGWTLDSVDSPHSNGFYTHVAASDHAGHEFGYHPLHLGVTQAEVIAWWNKNSVLPAADGRQNSGHLVFHDAQGASVPSEQATSAVAVGAPFSMAFTFVNDQLTSMTQTIC